jgi:hypothetical protein
VAYAGKQGPFGFRPAEVEKWLKQHASASEAGDDLRQHGPMYQRSRGRTRLQMESQNMQGPS